MKYTKKQIEESIKFWESELKKMDESNPAFEGVIPSRFATTDKNFDQLYDGLEGAVLQGESEEAYEEREAILADLVDLQARVADYIKNYMS